MTTNNNPRGLAYVKFLRTWDRMATWGWHAALTNANAMPTQKEYMDTALAIYDHRALDIDVTDDTALVETIHDICNELSRWLRSYEKGVLKYGTNNKMIKHYELTLDQDVYSETGAYLGTVGNNMPVDEPGYANAENTLAMQAALRIIRKRLNADDFQLVLHFLEGEEGYKGSYLEAGAKMGYSKHRSHRAFERIRKACEGLEWKDGTVCEMLPSNGTSVA